MNKVKKICKVGDADTKAACKDAAKAFKNVLKAKNTESKDGIKNAKKAKKAEDSAA